ATVGGSKQLVIHDIPVQVVAHRHWRDYDKPNVSRVKVAINLPPVKTLTKVIMGMKNIGGKHVVRIFLTRFFVHIIWWIPFLLTAAT
uniref:Uncharacterized protein n=1 Tax=Plectus sambesii TaxID=2011161 RepID=A0A914VM42_9BILA